MAGAPGARWVQVGGRTCFCSPSNQSQVRAEHPPVACVIRACPVRAHPIQISSEIRRYLSLDAYHGFALGAGPAAVVPEVQSDYIELGRPRLVQPHTGVPGIPHGRQHQVPLGRAGAVAAAAAAAAGAAGAVRGSAGWTVACSLRHSAAVAAAAAAAGVATGRTATARPATPGASRLHRSASASAERRSGLAGAARGLCCSAQPGWSALGPLGRRRLRLQRREAGGVASCLAWPHCHHTRVQGPTSSLSSVSSRCPPQVHLGGGR